MRVIRTAVVLVYHAKSVLRKDSPSSITPELRSRRILCRLLVQQQYLVRTSTRYQYIFISGMHKSRRVWSTAVHQQPCRVSDRQYEYVTVVYLSCVEGVVLLLSLQCSTGTRRIMYAVDVYSVDYSRSSSTWYVRVLDISTRTYLYQACIRAGESHQQQMRLSCSYACLI